ALSFPPLNAIVQIFERQSQPPAQSPAYRGFASAHETHEKHRPYFACMASRRGIDRRARTGSHPRFPETVLHPPSPMIQRLLFTFLEVNFTTEGKQLNRRCRLTHGTCEGTPGPGNKGSVLGLQREIVLHFSLHRARNYFDRGVGRGNRLNISA